tara:strand:- start:871 stop:1089 length:219 start_codon:yes stop_codon:yes gene_type:complete
MNLKLWLKMEDHGKKMAKAYIGGQSICQIAKSFNCTVPTVRYALKDYLPTEKQTNEFKIKFVRKQIKKLGGR